MGEEEVATAVAGAVVNGTTLPENEGGVLTEKKEERDGMKEMETDGNVEKKIVFQKFDVDKEEAKESKKEEKEETGGKEAVTEAMEEDKGEKSNQGSEEKVSELEEEKGNQEKIIEGKGSKKRKKIKIVGEIVERKPVKQKTEKEQKTPVASAIERPVRERKSVERLVASFEIEAVKGFQIAKGRGTALKDIPNVAYKLSKRKTDDTIKLLHTILFGRRGKVLQVKNNISLFSGFVWRQNEEKQKIKVKEKLDKCVKEKLSDICDVLDIPIPKATIKKDDIVAKLVDFCMAPYATTKQLLSEKEQSGKTKKRKRNNEGRTSTPGDASPIRSAKSRKGGEDSSKRKGKKSKHETDKELEDEQEKPVELETVNGVPEGSGNETPERAESEEKDNEPTSESEKYRNKRKRGSKKSHAKKESTKNSKTKKITLPRTPSPVPKKTPVKSSLGRSKVKDNNDTSPKPSSRKKKKNEVEIKKSSTAKKSAPKEKISKKVVKEKDKPKEEKTAPSDDELKNAICVILKEVDINTATFTDILKQLSKQFDTDLTPRKSSLKLMVQDELTKLADVRDADKDKEDDDDDEGAAVEKDDKQE